MKQVGEILKKEREKQDLSLHEIGLSLKINTKILKALEEGDQKQLPAKTFLRGFVKSYAQYLKMNPQEVLAAFDQEHKQVQQEKSAGAAAAVVQAQDKSITQMKPVEKTPFLKEFASSGRLATLIVAAVLLLMIIFVVQTMNKYQNEKMVAEATPPSTSDSAPSKPALGTTETSMPLPSASPMMPTKIDSATPASTNTTSAAKAADSSAQQLTAAPSPSSPVSPAASALPTVKPPPTSVSTQSPTSHSPTITASARPTPITPATTSVPGQVTKPATGTTSASSIAKPVATTATTTKPAPTPTAPTTAAAINAASVTTTSPTPTASSMTAPAPAAKPKSSTVLVEALNKVVIKYVVDGKNESLTLNAGQVHTFKGSKPGLVLEISDGGAVNVIVNGRDKGVPGEMGKPVKLTY